MSSEFEQAKAYLKKAAGQNGQNLYDHLTQVLVKLVQEQPDQALQQFESLSLSLKQQQYQSVKYSEYPSYSKDEKQKQQLLDCLSTIQQSLGAKKQSSGDDGEQEQVDEVAAADQVPIPDLVHDHHLLQQAGINLNNEQVYQLYLSIQQLANQYQLANVRFWGKIFGTKKDYYIVEAKLTSDQDDVDNESSDNKMEPIGTGANQYVYYVSNSIINSKWQRLPPVTPELIILSRQMRRHFTGDLSSSVLGFPRFPYSEGHYLRAQIARITAATTISPKGYYSLDQEDEDSGVMIEDEEFQGLSNDELLSADNWCHHRPHLLRQGRCKPWQEPEKEGDDDADADSDDKKDDEEEAEEPVPLLSSLDQDQYQVGKKSLPTWSYRLSPSSSNQHSIVSVHSLMWPGSVTVCKKKQFINIYIGYGQKYLATTYTPPSPPTI